MFKFTVALLAAVASASESYYRSRYGDQQIYRPSRPSPYDYGVPHRQSRYRPSIELHEPQQAPAYGSYGGYRGGYQAPAPATTHVENPWAPTPADPVTTGWYSPESEFSPPRIPFKSTAGRT